MKLLDRLMARGVWVLRDPALGECLEWQGGKSKGYGRVKLSGKVHLVHRIIATAFQVPGEGPHACHACNNPSCINPKHLRWDTPAGNVRQCVDDGRLRPGAGQAAGTVASGVARRAKTHCPAGHPYSGQNLYTYPGRSKRDCKTCCRARRVRYRKQVGQEAV